MEEIKLYTHSKYLRPKLSLREYSGLFATGVVGSSLLHSVGGAKIWWLVLAVLVLAVIYQINKI